MKIKYLNYKSGLVRTWVIASYLNVSVRTQRQLKEIIYKYYLKLSIVGGCNCLSIITFYLDWMRHNPTAILLSSGKGFAFPYCGHEITIWAGTYYLNKKYLKVRILSSRGLVFLFAELWAPLLFAISCT